ncbi:MAG TPA: TlpA disulfide reductase family protein [Dehalococcoidia bacterium]|nr:TlpA disulfide reductase family protein [Dehalococcoidia bacterium]
MTGSVETEAPSEPQLPQPEEAPRRRFNARLVLWPLGLVILGLMVAMGFKVARGNSTLGEVKLKPYTAPDFTLTQFSGDQFSLADERGKVVVVNFWASWCIPCKDEAPILESAWQRYQRQGVVFIGVDIKDTPDDARNFIRRYNVTYPNGFDGKKLIYIDYGVYGLPETFVVDQQGLVQHHVIGPTTSAQLDGWLDGLVTTGSAQQ